jgi:NUDIX domain
VHAIDVPRHPSRHAYRKGRRCGIRNRTGVAGSTTTRSLVARVRLVRGSAYGTTGSARAGTRGVRYSCTLTSVENLDSKQVYTDPWLSVRQDTVRRSDGSSGIYSVVDTADCSLVIPVDGDRVHMVEQYRYPVAGRRWEFPSGSTDHVVDTDAKAVASRELREETGLTLPR